MSTWASRPREPSNVSISNPTRRPPSRISLVRNPLSATPSSRSLSARRLRAVVFPAPGRASIRRRAGTARLVLEPLPLRRLAQSGPLRPRQEGDRCDHRGDEADEVQLEDVARVDEVRDRSSDHGARESESERPEQPDLLLAGQQKARQRADDEAGDDESDHDSLIPRGGEWDTRFQSSLPLPELSLEPESPPDLPRPRPRPRPRPWPDESLSTSGTVVSGTSVSGVAASSSSSAASSRCSASSSRRSARARCRCAAARRPARAPRRSSPVVAGRGASSPPALSGSADSPT